MEGLLTHVATADCFVTPPHPALDCRIVTAWWHYQVKDARPRHGSTGTSNASGNVRDDPSEHESPRAPTENRSRITTRLTTRDPLSRVQGVAVFSETPQRKPLQSLIFTQSGRRDLNPRPPEPHGVVLSGESRQRVATTRCSGHRCCESDPEDRPGIVAESQRNSRRRPLGRRRVR